MRINLIKNQLRVQPSINFLNKKIANKRSEIICESDINSPVLINNSNKILENTKGLIGYIQKYINLAAEDDFGDIQNMNGRICASFKDMPNNKKLYQEFDINKALIFEAVFNPRTLAIESIKEYLPKQSSLDYSNEYNYFSLTPHKISVEKNCKDYANGLCSIDEIFLFEDDKLVSYAKNKKKFIF